MVGKRGQQYAWIFSLIVGAVILFLALFAAQRFTETSEFQTQAELVNQFDILLNPFASIGAIATMTLSKSVEMPTPVQIEFSCDVAQNYNGVNLRTRKGKTGWSDWLPQEKRVKDKYIFSEMLEGKEFWVFAKPFEIPWRVDDLIYITDKSYCFEGAPEHIEREIGALGTETIGIKEGGKCLPDSVEVCFGVRSCEINVNYQLKTVKKSNAEILFAGDSLMYAAVFSDPEIYQCNFDRLVDRISTQIEINAQKARALEQKGCNTQGLQSSLASMKGAFSGKLIGNFESIARETERRNPRECPVFD